MRTIYYADEILARKALGDWMEPEDEILPEDLAARMEAMQRALDEPGVKEIRVFKTHRRFPVPPRKLRK